MTKNTLFSLGFLGHYVSLLISMMPFRESTLFFSYGYLAAWILCIIGLTSRLKYTQWRFYGASMLVGIPLIGPFLVIIVFRKVK